MTSELPVTPRDRIYETRNILWKNSLASQGGDWLYRVEDEASVYASYSEIGKLFHLPIQAEVGRILGDLPADATHQALQADEKTLVNRFERASKVIQKLESIAVSDSEFSPHVADYLNALSGWADGANILEVGKAYGFEIDPVLLALMLQDDNSIGGCQTCMVRVSSDKVFITHSEESVNVFDSMVISPVVSLNLEGEEYSTAVYSTLLPGSATCGGSSGMMIACDYLRTRKNDEGEALVNPLSWIIWRMGKDASPEKIRLLASEMGPFYDAYAINIVRDNGSGVEAFKAICVEDQIDIEMLGSENGSFLSQVNIIDPGSKLSSFGQQPESMPDGYYEGFLGRLKRISDAVIFCKSNGFLEPEKFKESKTVHEVVQSFMSMGFDEPDDWGFANNFAGLAISGFVRSKRHGESTIMYNLGPSVLGDTSNQKLVEL